jgi:hypothetical protein
MDIRDLLNKDMGSVIEWLIDNADNFDIVAKNDLKENQTPTSGPFSEGLEGLLLDIEEDGFITIRQETGWLVWDGKIMKRPEKGYSLKEIIRVAVSNKVPF